MWNVAMKTATATAAWRTSDGGGARMVVPAIRRIGLPGAIRVTILRIVGAGTSRGVRGSSTARIPCRGA